MVRTWVAWAFAMASMVCAPAHATTASSVTFPSLDHGVAIPARLIVPDGAGPFPGVVIVHDCSGLGPRSSGAPRRWSEELVPQGYAVIIPDSFTPRGLAQGVCTIGRERQEPANGFVRAADAYGALAYLRTLPNVDGKHVGIMGGSHGGWTTLASMFVPANPANPLAGAKRDGFAAGIALYPSCNISYDGTNGGWRVERRTGAAGPVYSYSGAYRPIAPLLILAGEADDWTPSEPCRRMVAASQAAGYPVDIKVYPGAHHAFDSNAPIRYDPNRTNGTSPTGKGATTGGNAAAWRDAKVEVRDFFARHLKPEG
ncbi:MAG: dienelactone hydrolase family protein [Gemmatimonas sp.]